MPAALDMNHAMIYSRNPDASLAFYRGALGFELLEEFQHEGRVVYARLRVPGSNATIALHILEPGKELHTGGIRLYFEVASLAAYCRKLAKAGVAIPKPPALMPWGWRHAYLNDPDGHEISLYSAGAKRLKKAKGLP